MKKDMKSTNWLQILLSKNIMYNEFEWKNQMQTVWQIEAVTYTSIESKFTPLK